MSDKKAKTESSTEITYSPNQEISDKLSGNIKVSDRAVIEHVPPRSNLNEGSNPSSKWGGEEMPPTGNTWKPRKPSESTPGNWPIDAQPPIGPPVDARIDDRLRNPQPPIGRGGNIKVDGVFAKKPRTVTRTPVPGSGNDNHLGTLGSAGVWPSVTGNTFLPGFTAGQGQLLMTHDNTCKVGGSRNEMVAADETITIDGNRTEKVGGNEQITIVGNRTEQVVDNETITVNGDRNITVSQSETAKVALNRTHSVGINEMINVGGAQEVTVSGVRLVNVDLMQKVNVGLKHTLHATNEVVITSAKIALDATSELTRNCGGGTITIDAAGNITIKGALVLINF